MVTPPPVVVCTPAARLAAPVTAKISFGWGKAGTVTIKSGVSTSVEPLHGPFAWNGGTGVTTYMQALAAKNLGSSYAATVAHLPTADPGAGVWYVPYGLGLLYGWGLASMLAGAVGFNPAQTWCYDQTPATGETDLFGAACHEIAEVLGWISTAPASLTPLDTLRFTAPGVLAGLVGRSASYFSPDGGVTNAHPFNAGTSGDVADWAKVKGSPDCRDATIAKSVPLPWSADDDAVMTALGWNCTNL